MNTRIARMAAGLTTVLTLAAGPLIAAEPVSIQVAMPSLVCGKGILEPNECVLSGTIRARGPETMNGPLRYYCDIKYTYVAAGSENQAIRFNGRVLHHGELTLEKGRAQRELAEQLTLKLSSHARQIEVAEIGCERE